MKNKAKARIDELVELINKWNEEYFDLESPSVSDRVYDTHLDELIKLEKEYPEYVDPNSPTQKIGASTKSKFAKVVHDKKMLSLNKAYDFNELKKFFNDIYLVVGNKKINFLVQPKIDGLSISLKYNNGILVQAVTRGDGQVGEDVTFNVKDIIKDVPSKIDYLKPLEVRGEIYISKENFLNIVSREKVNYANSRNLASGTLRQLDSNIVKERNLSIFIYDVVDCDQHNIDTQESLIKFLKKMNFPIMENYLIESFENEEKIFSFINEFENVLRDGLQYDIDGMVIKLNEINYYEEIGYTSKFPKYSIAYKFNEELVQTTLDDIFITVGRTGMVTYNAVLKPVLIKGTTVSAATLHNYSYIESLNLNVGDEVLIKKAGEIIPKVIAVETKKTQGIFKKIEICPYCNSKLIDTRTLNNQICNNPNCPEVNIKKIIHFTSKQCMDIAGLGEGIVRKFFEYGFIKRIEDIFTIEKHKDSIIDTKGFGDKFWKNLMQGITNSYNVSLEKLIFALGISQLGSKNAKSIAKRIKKFENILTINEQSLLSIKDIGEVTINEFIEYINKKENIDLINFLISININPEYEVRSKEVISFFEEKTFVISGTFDISRNELTRIIEENGGNVSSAVSKNTFALLLGDSGGSKKEKAKSLGIRIVNKDELKEILEGKI